MQLPINCTVDYLEGFLSKEEADELYHLLIGRYQIDQAQLIIQAGGKLIATDSYKILFSTERLIRQNTHPEQIHGKAYVWSGAMASLREKVESFLERKFELAMCLYYPNGKHFAPYHSDQETSGNDTILPSISLGGVRTFSFKDKQLDEEAYRLDLAHGSLLVMGAYCQSRYQHSLLQDVSYTSPRINITFREPGFQ